MEEEGSEKEKGEVEGDGRGAGPGGKKGEGKLKHEWGGVGRWEGEGSKVRDQMRRTERNRGVLRQTNLDNGLLGLLEEAFLEVLGGSSGEPAFGFAGFARREGGQGKDGAREDGRRDEARVEGGGKPARKRKTTISLGQRERRRRRRVGQRGRT